VSTVKRRPEQVWLRLETGYALGNTAGSVPVSERWTGEVPRGGDGESRNASPGGQTGAGDVFAQRRSWLRDLGESSKPGEARD